MNYFLICNKKKLLYRVSFDSLSDMFKQLLIIENHKVFLHILQHTREKLQTKIEPEHNQAKEIQAWYTNEYEVLPLWYKKFGHIIKAFKGERTFKSLFK